jgi:hypothetical protein
MPFPRRALPDLALVEQHLPSDRIADPRSEVKEKLLSAGLREKIRPGMEIAITADSRGTGGLADVVAGIADAIRAAGGRPFVIPAMGSHGGAVAQTQKEILAHFGVTEENVGAVIEATMDTIELGRARNGAMAHLDARAASADGIIVLGRVKTHPETTGELASGLLKMVVVGLGKQCGAMEAHTHGLWESIREVPRVVLERSRIIFGVAVVESPYRWPAAIEIVPPKYDAFLDTDKRLLSLAKGYAATIPFKHLDMLVLDEIGKDISGSGMDLNVVGNWRISNGPRIPDFHRIVVLSLTPASLGNGIGIGLADFTTERFAREFDPNVTYVNILTATERASNPREGSLPLALPSDREAMEVAFFSSLAGDKPQVCRVKNTNQLDRMWVSEGLLDEVRRNPKFSILHEAEPIAFDGDGNILHEEPAVAGH